MHSFSGLLKCAEGRKESNEKANAETVVWTGEPMCRICPCPTPMEDGRRDDKLWEGPCHAWQSCCKHPYGNKSSGFGCPRGSLMRGNFKTRHWIAPLRKLPVTTLTTTKLKCKVTEAPEVRSNWRDFVMLLHLNVTWDQTGPGLIPINLPGHVDQDFQPLPLGQHDTTSQPLPSTATPTLGHRTDKCHMTRVLTSFVLEESRDC